MFRRVKIKILWVALLLILSAVTAISPAHAAGPQVALSATSGRAGTVVVINEVDPCPDIENYQDIRVTFTDAGGTVWPGGYMSMVRPGNSGKWSVSYRALIQFRHADRMDPTTYSPTPTLGRGVFNVACTANGQVIQQYEPAPFTVTDVAPPIHLQPQSVVRGGQVRISSSVDVCSSSHPVHVTVGSADYFAEMWPEVNSADGSWSIDHVFPEKIRHPMSGQEVDLPLGAYSVNAECIESRSSYTALANFSSSHVNVVLSSARYVALGDSYSSGQGIGDYVSPGAPCNRSKKAYPYLIAQEFALGSPLHAACGGAVTDDFHTARNANERAQLENLSQDTEVVTLTIGGNDAGFFEVLDGCISRPDHVVQISCRLNAGLRDGVNRRLTDLEGGADSDINGRKIHSLESVYREIHAKASNAKIYVAGYPNLFGSLPFTYSRFYCNLVGVSARISYVDAQWINQLTARLNRAIEKAVNSARANGASITYVAPSAFVGRGLCDNLSVFGPWINGLLLTGDPLRAKDESFHPTATGDESGYKKDIGDAIRRG